jgi:hypothetical protein
MLIADGLIENVSFLTAPSTFSDISGHGGSDIAALPTNNLILGESLTTLSGLMLLSTSQPTTQAPGSTLTADTLLLRGGGSFTLNNVNAVSTLAASTLGAISFNNGTNALTIGSFGSVDGISTVNNDITITADSLTLEQPIDAGAGAGAGTVSLQTFTNTLPIRLGAASVAGSSYGLTDADLGQITAQALRLGSAAETGGISIVSPIARHGFTELDLTTGNTTPDAVTQSASLAVPILNVQAAGAVTLTSADNFVDEIAGSAGSGDFDFTDNASVTVKRLSPTDPSFGINASGNVTITVTAGNSTPGDLGLSWTVAGMNVTLTAAGSIVGSDIDPAAPANKITASDLSLSSGTGTGLAAAVPLVTTISNLVALNTTSGGIFVSNNGSLTIGFQGAPFQGVTDQADHGAISLSTAPGGIFTLNSGEDVAANVGDISITADDMIISGPITTGTTDLGIVTLQQASTTTLNIDLGTDPSPGNFGISQADLNHITANFVRLGRVDNPGNIMFTAQIAQPATVGRGLALLTGGAILNNSLPQTIPALIANDLRLQAGAGIGVNQSGTVSYLTLQVSRLAANNSTSGQVYMSYFGPLIIGAVDGLAGATNTGFSGSFGGSLQILGKADLTVNQPVSSNSFTVLQGAGTITLNAPITGPNESDVFAFNSGTAFTVTTSGATPLGLIAGNSYAIDFGQLNGPVNVGGGTSSGVVTVTLNSPPEAASYVVTATTSPDRSPSGSVTFNGGETVNYAGVQQVTINGGAGGGNSFDVQGTLAGTPVTINTGPGIPNAVIVGGADNTLANVAGPLTINGQGASDTLTINDQGDSAGQTFNLTAGSISGVIAVSQNGIIEVIVNGGSGSDTFNITPSATTVFSVHGNNPTPPSSGDQLNLNLAGITDATLSEEFNPSTGYSGSWSFTNAHAVLFDTIETLTPGPAVITSASSVTFAAGQPGSFLVTTTGSPTPSLTEAGALPDGVTFVDNHNGTATLSGAATTIGTFSFTITAANGVGNSFNQNFTLTISSVPNQTYVANAYHLLLGRTPDPGSSVWVNALDSGVSAVNVVLGIEGSAEYLNDQVAALYSLYLRRNPDLAGAQFWLSFLQAGGTFEQVAAQLSASPEYFILHGGTNQGFIIGLYQDVLKRNPSNAEVAGWEAALASGWSRLSVSTAFLTSQEYRTDLVESDYKTFLLRAADPGGLTTWVGALNAGFSDQDVLAGIFGSAEGYQLWS